MFNKDDVVLGYENGRETLEWIYYEIIERGDSEIFLCSAEINDAESFAGCMMSDFNHLYRIWYKEEEVGYFWLNRFMGNSCFVHFCGMRDTVYARKHAVKIGRFIIEDFLFDHYNILFGCILSSNRRLKLFLQKLLFKPACNLPRLYYVSSKNRHFDFELWTRTGEDNDTQKP